MSVVIRRAVPDEWAAARALRLRALADSPDAFASTLERELALDDAVFRTRLESAPTFFADDGGELVGSVTVIEDRHEPGGREIAGMWVAPEARRRGVGADLLRAALAWAADDGAAHVALWVADGNDAARRLYERLGFVDTGQRDVIRDGLGESRFRLPLG